MGRQSHGRRFSLERLESRLLLAVSLTRNANLVEMDMGNFLVKFDTQFGGAPLTWINQASGKDVVITDPFAGAGAQIVWNEDSSPTQASASGPTANPVARLGDTTSPQSFYGRETAFIEGQSATYEVSGFAPIFWWQVMGVSGYPSVDAVPDDVKNEWLTRYSPGSIGNNDAFWTGCSSQPRGCVPVVFEGKSQHSVFMLGSEAASYVGTRLWNDRLQAIPGGHVAMRARISLADSQDPNAIGSLMFQRNVPQGVGNVTAAMAATSPGYFLTINKRGQIVLGRVSVNGAAPETTWHTNDDDARASSVNSQTGLLLEVRTIRNGASDTFEVWADGTKIDAWTDSAPIRGPHVGLFAHAATGRVKFTDREVFDLNVEYVARYTGFADGHLQSDLRIRTTSKATSPSMMRFANLPIVFLGSAINPATTTGTVFNVFGDEICTAVPDGNPCLTPLGTAEDRGFAVWLGDPNGKNGVFTIPRTIEVNESSAIDANTQVVNGNLVIGNDIRAVQLNPFFSYPGPSVPITSARVVADWWPKIVPLPPPPPVKVSISNATLAENTDDLTFQISLDRASAQRITVDYATRNRTAIAGMDYLEAKGRVVFEPGETQRDVKVSAKEDEFIENDEVFEVALTNPVNAVVADGTGTGTIRDDENPELAYSSVRTFSEGNQTRTTATFSITLSDIPTVAPVRIAYRFIDGTARAGIDYESGDGEVAFAVVAEVAGTRRPTVDIPLKLIGNCSTQPNRAFQIQFSAPDKNVRLGDGVVTITIVDDDVAGDLSCDGKLDDLDIDVLAAAIRAGVDRSHDQDGNGRLDSDDTVVFVDRYFQTVLGDTNLDRRFDSADLVAVFAAGEYENGVTLDSGWRDGDWNGDGEFDTSDLVAAFQAGGYRAE